MFFSSLVWQMLEFISLCGSRRWLKLISCLLAHYQWLFRGSLLDLFLLSSSDLGGGIWWLLFQTMKVKVKSLSRVRLTSVLSAGHYYCWNILTFPSSVSCPSLTPPSDPSSEPTSHRKSPWDCLPWSAYVPWSSAHSKPQHAFVQQTKLSRDIKHTAERKALCRPSSDCIYFYENI